MNEWLDKRLAEADLNLLTQDDRLLGPVGRLLKRSLLRQVELGLAEIESHANGGREAELREAEEHRRKTSE